MSKRCVRSWSLLPCDVDPLGELNRGCENTCMCYLLSRPSVSNSPTTEKIKLTVPCSPKVNLCSEKMSAHSQVLGQKEMRHSRIIQRACDHSYINIKNRAVYDELGDRFDHWEQYDEKQGKSKCSHHQCDDNEPRSEIERRFIWLRLVCCSRSGIFMSDLLPIARGCPMSFRKSRRAWSSCVG
jgi:hypothetical protein